LFRSRHDCRSESASPRVPKCARAEMPDLPHMLESVAGSNDEGESQAQAYTPKTPKTPSSALIRALRATPTKMRTAARLGFETPRDKERLMTETKDTTFNFWKILLLTSFCSATLSFAIDQFSFIAGIYRERFTTLTSVSGLAGITIQNVVIVLVARVVVRTTVECEGSGFPEMKAMLFGHMLDSYLSLRVLAIKAFGLASLLAAGLPIGKEGPNCHMAACIARNLDRDFVSKRSRSVNGQAQINKLLMAAVSVGVGASWSAPIGGVIFAMELMLPQVQDFTSYWGCFLAGISGSFVFEVYRTWFSGAALLVPLMSTNVLPGEGSVTSVPILRMMLDVVLGVICGYLGGNWVRMHARCAKLFKDFRLAAASKQASAGMGLSEPLLGEPRLALRGKAAKVLGRVYNFQWRDLLICTAVTVINTWWSAQLPLLNGQPQPMLLSNLFDKNLLTDRAQWELGSVGLVGTLTLCAMMKWCTTIMALSLSMPTGVVAPTMIIGGLIGRMFGSMLPDALVDFILANADGSPITDEVRGAYMARFAMIGAASFCAAVTRAFAMAITVFEVLSLPNDVLPLCSASLVSIFVANTVELPFFDRNLASRGLGGIPALTFTDHADAPAFSIMRVIDVTKDCLYFKTRLFDMNDLLKRHPKQDYFPIVRMLEDGEAVLVASMSRRNVNRVIDMLDPHAAHPETLIDLLDPELQRPSDGSPPLVDGCPPHVSPSTTAKEVYLVMRVAHGEDAVYVTRDGALLGDITFASLMSHQP